MISCKICDQTMGLIAQATYWCPRCGAMQQDSARAVPKWIYLLHEYLGDTVKETADPNQPTEYRNMMDTINDRIRRGEISVPIVSRNVSGAEISNQGCDGGGGCQVDHLEILDKSGHDTINEKVQAFPSHGPLAENLSKPLSILKGQIGNPPGRAYSYVVTSVELNGSDFEQRGCGPNFQGGKLTLCTCKHRMRAGLPAEEWQREKWIVGFTSRSLRNGEHKHWLFFVAKVQSAYKSHSDLWSNLDVETRSAKSAHIHYLGDVYKPKHPRPIGDLCYSPDYYVEPPFHAHRNSRHPFSWMNDISYQSSKRHPPLLVADPELTFLWDKPTIFLEDEHCRDRRKWRSIQQLLSKLQETS